MSLKREVLTLLLVVLVVDAVFLTIYFLTGLRYGSDATKLAFTVVWTLLTLAVVIRGLSRIRVARIKGTRSRPE